MASMVLGQARMETRLLLRNGEQLLLTLVIPLVLLVVLAKGSLVDLGAPEERLDLVVAGVLTVAVMSSSFTSLAIGTGFERRYQVLRRLGVTPLPRTGLLLGKALGVLAMQAIQVFLVLTTAVALGWRPDPAAGLPMLLALLGFVVLVGTAAFAGLGLLMAGTLRAEATLAAANLVYVLLLLAGGSVVPVASYPEAIQPILQALPSGALGEAMRAVVATTEVAWSSMGVLLAWAILGFGLAARTFRWD